MHTLLLPFDGSGSAVRAVQYAIALARDGAPVAVHLVNAFEPPTLRGEAAAQVPREVLEASGREHAGSVLARARRLLDEAGVPCTEQLLVGPAAESIAACADAQGCRAIVMGTRGMTAIGNLLMGSVATKVVHLANVPVTLVK